MARAMPRKRLVHLRLFHLRLLRFHLVWLFGSEGGTGRSEKLRGPDIGNLSTARRRLRGVPLRASIYEDKVRNSASIYHYFVRASQRASGGR